MCFVLDANSFHCLFSPGSKGYANFSPLRDWLFNHPRTSLVIGGKTYRNELDKFNSYDHVKLLGELNRARKWSEIVDDVVDAEEQRITALVNHPNFNDAHIVAIFCASGCLVLASHDKRADKFIKMRELYKRGQKPPSIYRYSKNHKNLLVDANIVRLRNLR